MNQSANSEFKQSEPQNALHLDCDWGAIESRRHTAWIFNLDKELRKSVEVSFSRTKTHFFQKLSLARLEALSERIQSSRNPIALYVTPPTSGERAHFQAIGVPVARLRMVPFWHFSETGAEDPIPCGYFIDVDSDEPTVGFPVRFGDWLQAPEFLFGGDSDALSAELERYIAAIRREGDSVPVPGGTRKAAIFANDLAWPPEGKAAASESYLELALKAREQCPGWEITFFTNGETSIPREIASQIRSVVQKVDHAPYSVEQLAQFSTIFVHDSVAAVDGTILGKTVVLSATSAFLPPPENIEVQKNLPAAFIAMLERRIRWIDPVGLRIVDGFEAIEKFVTDPQRVKSSSRKDGQVRTFWATLLPGPVEKFKVQDDIPSTWKIREPQFEERGGGQGSLSLPEWISHARRSAPEAMESETGCVSLRADIAKAPQDVVQAGITIIDVDADWSAGTSAARVSDFALTQPEAFTHLVNWKLQGFTGKYVIACDLTDVATRLFLRECRRIGLASIYVPPTVAKEEEGGDFPSDPLSQYATLVDLIIAWDKSHLRLAQAAGLPGERVLPALMRSLSRRGAEGEAPGFVVHFSRALPGDDEDAGKLVLNLAILAQAAGQPFLLSARSDFYAQLSERILDQLERLPSFRYELLPFEEVPLIDRLNARPLVVTLDQSVAWQAERMGCPAVFVSTERDVSVEAVMQSVSEAMEKAEEVSPFSPVADTPFDDVLAKLLRAPIPKRGSAIDKVLQNTGERINLISSSVLPETLSKTERYELPMLRADSWIRSTALTSLSDLVDVDLFVQWGIRSNYTRAATAAYARRLKRDILILEDGFIRSIEIGLSGTPALSMIMDDLTAFYDATKPSRLETILNSDLVLTPEQIDRARSIIDSIVRQKVTKYNFAPYRKVSYGGPDRKKILLIDQREGDQSIESGLAGPESFRKMVSVALSMTEEYDLLVKTHPDANIGGKSSAISEGLLGVLAAHRNAFVITEDMNPYSLIDSVEKVFVVTSGVGFEAAMAGKDVWCFGVPFYSGWGITRDMVELPRRKQRRSIEEIFFVSYIMMSRYFHPGRQENCEVEDLIEHICGARPWILNDADDSDEIARPQVRELPSRGADVDAVPIGSTLWLLGADELQQAYFAKLFKDCRVMAVATVNTLGDFYQGILASRDPVVLDFTSGSIPGLKAFVRARGIKCYTPSDSGDFFGNKSDAKSDAT